MQGCSGSVEDVPDLLCGDADGAGEEGMSKLPKGWKSWPENSLVYAGSRCFYQKKVGHTFINVVEWVVGLAGVQYHVEFDLDVKKQVATRVQMWPYMVLDFKRMEADALMVIKRVDGV